MDTAFFELVEEIKADLKSIYDLRLQVAINLAKAHELFDKNDPAAEGMTWGEFATTHFGLSWSEIKKLVRIGSSDDPEKAMAAHREETCKSVTESRKSNQKKKLLLGAPEMAEADGGGDSPKQTGENGGPEPGTVEQQRDRIIRAYKAESDEARGRFRQWLAGKDGKDALPGDLSVKPGAMRGPPAQAIPAT